MLLSWHDEGPCELIAKRGILFVADHDDFVLTFADNDSRGRPCDGGPGGCVGK